MVGAGDTVGVTAEIAEHVPGAAESRFGVDHPILPVEAAEQFADLLLVG